MVLGKGNKISIHAPAKGATRYILLGAGLRRIFQSTLPRRERHLCWQWYDDPLRFQSTLPRRERRPSSLLPPVLQLISIHAPAKGATTGLVSLGVIPKFQSTLPRRERRRIIFMQSRKRSISIHAPAKGATLHSDLSPPGCSRFQSTLPRRERLSSDGFLPGCL